MAASHSQPAVRAGFPFRKSLTHLFGNPSLYRFGFLASPSPPRGDTIWDRLNWRTETHRGLIYWLHPETPFEIVGDRVVIGHAFDLNLSRPILEALDGAHGRFVVVDGDHVYHDAFGSRSIYYGEGLFASHAPLIAHATRARRSVSVRRIIDSATYQKKTVRYLPGDLTVYENIYALPPNHRLTAGGVERYWPREPLSPTTRSDFLNAACNHLREVRRNLSDRSVVFGLTGGADTRALVSAFEGDFRRGHLDLGLYRKG